MRERNPIRVAWAEWFRRRNRWPAHTFRTGGKGQESGALRLDAELLTDAPTAPSDLVGADQKSLPVNGWYDNYNPKLGNTPLYLERLEMSRSLAIAPDAATLRPWNRVVAARL